MKLIDRINAGIQYRRECAPVILRKVCLGRLRAHVNEITVSLGSEAPTQIAAAIEILRRPDPSWAEVFEAEQILIHALPDPTVSAEFVRRLSEAETLKLPSAENFKNAVNNSTQDKRKLLSALVGDINRSFVKRRVDRFERYDAGTRLLVISLVVLATLLVPVLLYRLFHVQSGYGPLLSSKIFSWLYAPIAFGSAGALFSRLIAFQNSSELLDYEALKGAYLVRWIMLRIVVGIFGALIIQILLRGQFINGPLFPSLDNPSDIDVMKLLVWSFVGGFSERLVPRTLEGIDINPDKGRG
ncbi:hypothetical protein V7799_18080 [Rhizobium laguerreae]